MFYSGASALVDQGVLTPTVLRDTKSNAGLKGGLHERLFHTANHLFDSLFYAFHDLMASGIPKTPQIFDYLTFRDTINCVY